MENKTFTKGMKVTYLRGDIYGKGKVYIFNLVVYSCGKKQMILATEDGVKFAGTQFKPTVEQGISGRVYHRLTQEVAEAAALALSADLITHLKEYSNDRLNNPHYDHDWIRAELAVLDATKPDFKWGY